MHMAAIRAAVENADGVLVPEEKQKIFRSATSEKARRSMKGGEKSNK